MTNDSTSGGPQKCTPGKPKGALGDLVKAESMIQFAISLPLGCLIGWFLGSLVDRHFHLHFVAIVGILLGAVGGFLQIYRVASGYMKDPGN